MFRSGEYVHCREARCLATLFDAVFSAQPAYESRLTTGNRKYAAEIKQVARLHAFNISAKRSGRGRELNAELRKPALRACRLRALTAHHLPECAPPSTCSTSPVTWRASVR